MQDNDTHQSRWEDDRGHGRPVDPVARYRAFGSTNVAQALAGLTIFPIWQERSDGPPVVLGSTDTLVAAAHPGNGFRSRSSGPTRDLAARRRRAAPHRSASLPDVRGLMPLPEQSGVLIGFGGRPALIELFADERLLASAWPRILAAAAREAAGRPDRATDGYLAREFIGLVEQLQVRFGPVSVSGRAIHATRGPLELRGLADARRVLHASVINHEAVGA